MKSSHVVFGSIMLSLLLFGCYSYHYVYSPLKPAVSNNFFDAEIRLLGAKNSYPVYYNGVALKIKNKTNQPIEIIWDQTKYLHYDNVDGGFMEEGTNCNKRHESVPPEVISPYSTITKKLYPVNLVILSNQSNETGTFNGDEKLQPGYECQHEAFKLGENGILLAVKVGKEILHDKISHNLEMIQYQQDSDGFE